MQVESTAAKYIQRFRQGEPLPRNERRRNKKEMWWAQTQQANQRKRISRTEVFEPGNDMPLFLQCHRGNAQSRDLENKHPVLLCTGVHVAPVTPLNSPRGHPWRDALPRQPTNDDTTKKGYQAGQHIPGAFFGGELCESDETFGGCGRESDELAGLDDRARTLLEYCRDLLTPPPTTFDQVRGVGNFYSGTAQYLCSVSSRMLQETSPLGENSWRQLEDSHQVSMQGSAGLEERVWMLLHNHEGLPAIKDTNFLSEHHPPVLNGVFEDSKRSVVAFPSEKHAYCFEEDYGSQSTSVPRSSHIDPVIPKDGNGIKRSRSVFSSLPAGTGAQGMIGTRSWLGDDPVLSALLRRFGEIEAEIERRTSTIRN